MHALPAEFDPVAVTEAIRVGNRHAEDNLVVQFRPRIVAFLSVRQVDRDTVEELAQEILMAVVCAARDGRVREPENLAAFVYGVARNLLNDRLRRRSREKSDPLRPGDDFPAPDPGPEDERVRIARREIERLDPVDRNILLMTLVQGLKPGEIAAAMRMPSDVVRQRKSRSLKKIMENMNRLSQSVSRFPLPDMEAR
ncbi:MAG: RNA polymerase sigma factor [Bryobacteraceae bacterium]